MPYEFRLPDIGEGVAEGEILKWLVKEGESVSEDQPLVEVMTDKVNVQIPSPRAGRVSKILAGEGEVVKVGQLIVSITETGAEGPSQQGAAPGPETTVKTEVARSPVAPVDRVLAAPATRRLARELGVELTSVTGTGPGGRVTDEDVRRIGKAVQVTSQEKPGVGQEELVPLRGVRKIISERLLRSSMATAHVTHVDEADVTELAALRESLRGEADRLGVKLTFLPFFIKATIEALKEFPYLNSTLDEEGGNIVLKKYYNLGIASDTDEGLIVPVLKAADQKDVFTLAAELEKLSGRARAGQLALDEVHGSTFTITNVGSVGGLFATPIINYPEVAILGTHKIMKRPVVREGKIEMRDMIYLSLTFDHRVVDGAYAARFMKRLVEILQDPKALVD